MTERLQHFVYRLWVKPSTMLACLDSILKISTYECHYQITLLVCEEFAFLTHRNK